MSFISQFFLWFGAIPLICFSGTFADVPIFMLETNTFQIIQKVKDAVDTNYNTSTGIKLVAIEDNFAFIVSYLKHVHGMNVKTTETNIDDLTNYNVSYRYDKFWRAVVQLDRFLGLQCALWFTEKTLSARLVHTLYNDYYNRTFMLKRCSNSIDMKNDWKYSCVVLLCDQHRIASIIRTLRQYAIHQYFIIVSNKWPMDDYPYSTILYNQYIMISPKPKFIEITSCDNCQQDQNKIRNRDAIVDLEDYSVHANCYTIVYSNRSKTQEKVLFASWSSTKGLVFEKYFDEQFREHGIGQNQTLAAYEDLPYCSAFNGSSTSGKMLEVILTATSPFQNTFEIFMTNKVKVGGVPLTTINNDSLVITRYGDMNLYRMGAMYMTPESHKMSPSLRKGYLRVVLRKPEIMYKDNSRMYFDSFVPIVWLASAVAIFACHVMLCISEVASMQTNASRPKTWLQIMKRFLNGSVIETNVKDAAAKVFAFTMAVTVVLCHQYYNSVMTSFLTVRHEITPFDDINDFRTRTDYKLAIMGHFSMFLLERLIETDHIFKQLEGKMETIDHAQSGLLLPEPTIIRRLYTEKLALLVDEETAEAIFLHNCSFQQTKLRIPMDYFHFGIFNRNPFYELISNRILNMRESGVLRHILQNRLYNRPAQCNTQEITTSQGLLDVVPVFGLLALGVIFSLVAFIFEKYIHLSLPKRISF